MPCFRAIVVDFHAVVVDNLNNSSELAVRRVAAIAGDHSRNLAFHKFAIARMHV
uniref:Uncharacterized protein n=1 Tax=Oryza barthii TaxID=65489 RepID=A0A0D3GZM6_9ORYZ